MQSPSRPQVLPCYGGHETVDQRLSENSQDKILSKLFEFEKLFVMPSRQSKLSFSWEKMSPPFHLFLKFLLAQASFSATFLVRVAGRAVGVKQHVSACDIRNVQHQIHLEGV